MIPPRAPAAPARRIAGPCGSLRAGSFNGLALRLEGTQLPEGWAPDMLRQDGVPPFNADLLVRSQPAAVCRIREQVTAADGLVIATPEYSFSLPGMLKNLIDWLSPGDDQPLAGKPARSCRPRPARWAARACSTSCAGCCFRSTHPCWSSLRCSLVRPPRSSTTRALHRPGHGRPHRRPEAGLCALDRLGPRQDARSRSAAPIESANGISPGMVTAAVPTPDGPTARDLAPRTEHGLKSQAAPTVEDGARDAGAERMDKGLRREHSAAFKAKLAIEAHGDGRRMTEIAQKHDVHPKQATEWRRQPIERAAGLSGR